MIAGIDTSGAIQSLYPSYNKKKVNKVKKVGRGGSSATEVSNKKSEEDTIEASIASTMQANLAEETEGLEMLHYADNNPYVAAKKSLDSSFLLGMNIDEKA